MMSGLLRYFAKTTTNTAEPACLAPDIKSYFPSDAHNLQQENVENIRNTSPVVAAKVMPPEEVTCEVDDARLATEDGTHDISMCAGATDTKDTEKSDVFQEEVAPAHEIPDDDPKINVAVNNTQQLTDDIDPSLNAGAPASPCKNMEIQAIDITTPNPVPGSNVYCVESTDGGDGGRSKQAIQQQSPWSPNVIHVVDGNHAANDGIAVIDDVQWQSSREEWQLLEFPPRRLNCVEYNHVVSLIDTATDSTHDLTLSSPSAQEWYSTLSRTATSRPVCCDVSMTDTSIETQPASSYGTLADVVVADGNTIIKAMPVLFAADAATKTMGFAVSQTSATTSAAHSIKHIARPGSLPPTFVEQFVSKEMMIGCGNDAVLLRSVVSTIAASFKRRYPSTPIDDKWFSDTVQRCFLRRYSGVHDVSAVKSTQPVTAVVSSLDCFSAPRIPASYTAAAASYALGEQHAALWTHKYRPVAASHVCGNAAAVKCVRDWLEAWRHKEPDVANITPQKADRGNVDEDEDEDEDDCGPLSGRRRKRTSPASKESSSKPRRKYTYSSSEEESDADEEADPSLCNCMLIVGPTGSGKTAAVHAIAADLGYSVIELNAGMFRARKTVDDLIGEATKSRRVHMKGNSVIPSAKPPVRGIMDAFTKPKAAVDGVNTSKQMAGNKRGRAAKEESPRGPAASTALNTPTSRSRDDDKSVVEVLSEQKAKKPRTIADMWGKKPLQLEKSAKPADSIDLSVFPVDDGITEVAVCGPDDDAAALDAVLKTSKGRIDSGQNSVFLPENIDVALPTANKQTIIVIEDIDIHFGAVLHLQHALDDVLDRGFATIIRDLLQEARCPIVLIGNGIPANVPNISWDATTYTSVSPFSATQCMVARFDRPTVQEAVATLLGLILAENVHLPCDDDLVMFLETFVTARGCDLRRCINDLQFQHQQLASSSTTLSQMLASSGSTTIAHAVQTFMRDVTVVAASNHVLSSDALADIKTLKKSDNPLSTVVSADECAANIFTTATSSLSTTIQMPDVLFAQFHRALPRLPADSEFWNRRAASRAAHKKASKNRMQEVYSDSNFGSLLQDAYDAGTINAALYTFTPPSISLPAIPSTIATPGDEPTQEPETSASDMSSTSYDAEMPVVHSVSPPYLLPQNIADDGVTLTLHGKHLTAASALTVQLGDYICTQIEVVDDSTLRVNVPAAVAQEWITPGPASDCCDDEAAWVRCVPSLPHKQAKRKRQQQQQLETDDEDLPEADEWHEDETATSPEAVTPINAQTSDGCVAGVEPDTSSTTPHSVMFLDVRVCSKDAGSSFIPRSHNRLLIAASDSACDGDPTACLMKRSASIRGFFSTGARFVDEETLSSPSEVPDDRPIIIPAEWKTSELFARGDLNEWCAALDVLSWGDVVSVPHAAATLGKTSPLPCYPVVNVLPGPRCKRMRPRFVEEQEAGDAGAPQPGVDDLSGCSMGYPSLVFDGLRSDPLPTHNDTWNFNQPMHAYARGTGLDARKEVYEALRALPSFQLAEGERGKPASEMEKFSVTTKISTEKTDASWLEWTHVLPASNLQDLVVEMEADLIAAALPNTADYTLFEQVLQLSCDVAKHRTRLSYLFTMFMRNTGLLALVPQGPRALLLTHGFAPGVQSCQSVNCSNLDALATLRRIVKEEERLYDEYEQAKNADDEEISMHNLRIRRRRGNRAALPYKSYLVDTLGVSAATLTAYADLWYPHNNKDVA